MKFCASICFNEYALALLLFALFVKILLLPFGIKQQSTQIKTAKLRPKVAAIEKKYAGRTDRPTLQKKQQEIMELQQKEGVSAFGGCLPLLIQLPIIFALYSVVREPLTYLASYSATDIQFIGWSVPSGSGLAELSLISKLPSGVLGILDIPDFSVFGINLFEAPSADSASAWLLIIPIFTGALSFFSMWLTRRLSAGAQLTGDKQKSGIMMNLVMAFISAYFAYTWSGALGLYWAYQSLLGILQSIILAKVMPLPKFTDADLKRAEKEMKVDEVRAAPVKIHSLHHIDDDDDEDEAVATATGVSSRYGDDDDEDEAETEAKSKKIEQAPMKSDDRPARKKSKKSKNTAEEAVEAEKTEDAAEADAETATKDAE